MGYVTNLIATASLVLIPVFSSNPVEIIVNQSSPIATSTTVERSIMRQVKRPEPSATQIALINEKADEYNVSAEVMTKVIACESGFVEDVQSRHITRAGTREESYGLVQINLPSHPSVSYEQAIDPVFAVEFLARNLADGRGGMWTCYNMHYGKS